MINEKEGPDAAEQVAICRQWIRKYCSLRGQFNYELTGTEAARMISRTAGVTVSADTFSRAARASGYEEKGLPGGSCVYRMGIRIRAAGLAAKKLNVKAES